MEKLFNLMDLQIRPISVEISTTCLTLKQQIEEADDGYLCVCRPSAWKTLNVEKVRQFLARADVIHGGLHFHLGKPFERLQLCAFNWHFLNPAPSIASNSWKASADVIIFRKAVYEAMGGMDVDFDSLDSMLMDFSYRVLKAGGVTFFVPGLVGTAPPESAPNSTFKDEARFIVKHLGARAFAFYKFCILILHFRWIRKPKRIRPENVSDFNFTLLQSAVSRTDLTQYTAIIPTIDRYDYIAKSIDSLIALKEPPLEIIVIDQTPPKDRRPEIYEHYDRKLLRVIYLDEAGQSTARNVGVAAARFPWLLLFEDDAEAWPDMVRQHFAVLSASAADVSSGVVVAPGHDASFILPSNRKFFISDIFTTGNAFVARDTLLDVNGFDIAFDRGSGADDDIGKRLYLAGKQIVYNHKSIETHYKAPRGGMRVHGQWWRNKTSLLSGAFPPASQFYAVRKYYPRKYWILLVLSWLLKAKKTHSAWEYLALLILFPYKFAKSWVLTKNLERATKKP